MQVTIKSENKIRKFITSRTLAAFVLFVVANLFIFGQSNDQKKELTLKILTDNPNEQRQKGRWVWWVSRNYLKKILAEDLTSVIHELKSLVDNNSNDFNKIIEIETLGYKN